MLKQLCDQKIFKTRIYCEFKTLFIECPAVNDRRKDSSLKTKNHLRKDMRQAYRPAHFCLSEIAYLVAAFVHIRGILASAATALVLDPAETCDVDHAVFGISMLGSV